MQLDTITPDAVLPQATGRLHGDLAITDVRFSYPIAIGGNGRSGARDRGHGPADARTPRSGDADWRKPPDVLRGISMRIRAGETVALVGETGAGKSTVMKLLARFYDPDEGSITVDGFDLRSIELRSFRRQLGYVPQEAFLFSGTIRDNIAYGRPDASDARVESAARAVGAHDFIARLSGGYHHELTERGRSLSSGQRQLIALARAELVEPALLLLDEATSNLDLVTEAHVAAAMQEVSQGRTTIVIAHRLQTARAADRIIVLHAGEIVEVGSHDELLARGGRYASMWEAFEFAGQGAG
jgi:ATP-binding cassette subfamily B protein